ncbi:hypothetical protein SAMN05444672_103258 [Bacillus sp. OK838]|nr:hypothetical protein SAMN05444672_103258 [Bacillus sp. OK838]
MENLLRVEILWLIDKQTFSYYVEMLYFLFLSEMEIALLQ